MMREFRRAAAGVTIGLGLASAAPPAGAQILNTLRGFDAGEPGWSGGLGASFSASGGNTDKVSLGGSGRVQWRDDTNRWRLMLDGSRARSNGELDEAASTVHLRHNARLASQLESIAFVQHQYDRFQRLDSRFLLGAGLRWDVLAQERMEVALGASPMLEVEREEGDEAIARGRLSTFLSVIGRLDERSSVDVTTFVQPAMADAGDLRAVLSASLRVAVAGNVSLVVGGRLQYDSEPAADVEKTDGKIETGLSISL